MNDARDFRPSPDDILQKLRRGAGGKNAGKLKVFFGMCAGVGKTYEMLRTAHEERRKGTDVVVGYVETHGRAETEALVDTLEVVPRREVEYRGTRLTEMDLDAILARKPALVLVDELAHTNAPSCRHPKRYHDVTELLENGISVYTTLNVQHLESRAETVGQITGAAVRETVPDSMFELADDVELIDITPDELLERLAEGKVYAPERSQRARDHFFRKGNLTALREMALRLTAERVDHQLRDYMRGERIAGPWKSGQRLLVAVGPGPHSASVIRWARRTAFTFNATWIAAHVDLPRPLKPQERKRLEDHFRLARELGAEVITTADVSIHQGLLRVARQENATHILVGKSARQSGFWRKSLFDRLLDESRNVDIYVVAGDEDRPPSLRERLPQPVSPWWHYAVAAATVFAVASVSFPFRSLLGHQTVSLLLLLTVTLLALRLGAGPIFLAAALSAAVWDLFFIPPLFTWRIHAPEDVLMLGAYFVIALVTGILSARTRANDRALRLREERANALFALTRDLSRSTTVNGVIEMAVRHLQRFFSADVVFYLSAADGDLTNTPHHASTYKPDEKEFAAAAWAYWNERKAGRSTDTLPGTRGLYFPLAGPRYPLGVIGVHLPEPFGISVDQETLLQNFLDQIASALERETLNEHSAKSMVIAESERLYKTLFDSISHEMRTPLAAITGSAEELLRTHTRAEGSVQEQLATDIDAAAKRLNRLVENLLGMTRLQSGHIRPRPDWCDIRDVVNGAVERHCDLSPGQQVDLEIPDGLPLMKLDFSLVEQALANVVHNARLYSPPHSVVKLRVSIEGQECIIRVLDHGPGIPPGCEERIFDKFYRLPGTRPGGTGLGLSITRGFIAAHNGTITARNARQGGAEFTIRLPIHSPAHHPEHQ